MAEGAAAPAAPAQGATATTQQSNAPAQPSEGQAKSAVDWGEADDKTLVELLRRKSKADPRARVRVRGEEKGFESLDDFYRVVGDAQRSAGATKVVEEAKKARAEAEKVQALRKAAAEGDLEALYELAGDKGIHALEQIRQQRAQEAEAEKQLSPTERELLRRNQELQKQAAELQRAQQEAQRQQRERMESESLSQVKREASENVKSILAELKLPPEKSGALLPFMATAMHDAMKLGLDLKTDVPPQAILEHAREMAAEASQGFTKDLTPAQRYDFHGEEYVAGLVREYLKRKKLGGGQPAAPVPEDALPGPSPQRRAPAVLGLMGIGRK